MGIYSLVEEFPDILVLLFASFKNSHAASNPNSAPETFCPQSHFSNANHVSEILLSKVISGFTFGAVRERK